LPAQRLPLGVDLNQWPPRAPRRREREAAGTLIHVASLNRVKDQRTLLRALAALKAAGLRFQMDDDRRGYAAGRDADVSPGNLGLSESVRFRGFLTQRQLRPIRWRPPT
jgi:hypothetical protein